LERRGSDRGGIPCAEIADQLPTDIGALQALVAAARAQRAAATAERDRALSQMDRLRHLLLRPQRAPFGHSAAGASNCCWRGPPRIRTTRQGHARAPRSAAPIAARFPTPLPHVDVTIAPEDTNGPCCRAPMHVIGEEISKRLDVIPRRASTSSARCWRSGWAIRGTPAALASAARAYPHRGQDRD